MLGQVILVSTQDSRGIQTRPTKCNPKSAFKAQLEELYRNAQNDFNPVEGRCSASCGDVIKYKGKYYFITKLGFKKISSERFSAYLEKSKNNPDFVWDMVWKREVQSAFFDVKQTVELSENENVSV